MKQFVPRFLLLCLLLALTLSSHAANWHPFPFAVSYYGKIVSDYDPLHGFNIPNQAPAWWVDGLYLDLNVGNTKTRSSLYPAGSGSIFYNATIETLGSGAIRFSGTEQVALNGDYYPDRIKLGQMAHGQVTFLGVDTILGTPDSVAQVSYMGNTLIWSKNHGIYRFSGTEEYCLLGIRDLNKGWQDPIYRLKTPQPGDEFHTFYKASGTISCNSPWGSSTQSENARKMRRYKILEVESSNSMKVLVTESDSGSATGVDYVTWVNPPTSLLSQGIYLDSVGPVGTSPESSYQAFFGLIDPRGVTQKVLLANQLDLPEKLLFLHCAKSPAGMFFPEYPIMSNLWCTGSIFRIEKPVYVQVAGACTLSTPLPPVVVTGTKNQLEEATVRAYPQPARDHLFLEGIREGKVQILNALGQTLLSARAESGPLSVSGLASGLYLFRYQPVSGPAVTGKWWKE